MAVSITLSAKARTGAGEYAKRIVREQMAPKPSPAPSP